MHTPLPAYELYGCSLSSKNNTSNFPILVTLDVVFFLNVDVDLDLMQ